MHDKQTLESSSNFIMKIMTSSVFHIVIALLIVHQLAIRSDLFSNEPTVGFLIGSLILLGAIGGILVKEGEKRAQLFSFILLISWVLTLALSGSQIGNILIISIGILTFFAAFNEREAVLFAGIATVVGIEVGWVTQDQISAISDLSEPLMSLIVVLAYSLLLYKLVEPSKSKQQVSGQAPNQNDSSERKKLSALVNSMADGVIATDQDQKVTIYNGAALDVLNLNVSLEGQNLEEHLHLIDSKGEKVDIFAEAHKSRSNYVSRDLKLQYDDDQTINLYISVAPIRAGYGEQSTLGYIFLMRDITKEKSLEEERDEFISVVSHELRTPITVAEGSISNAQLILEKTPDNAKGLDASLKEAHKSSVFLADMINDLSTLSRAERGKLEVEAESVDIAKLLNDLQEDYKIQTKQKGLELKVAKLPKIQPVNTSPLYLKEILQNFITNSIKYTEKGSITLSAKHTDRGVDIKVADTGIGISKSDKKKLFDKFFRSEDYRTRQNSGTGLGLYVTMKLTRLIGASIDVQSEIDKGSEFTISVPDLEAHHHRKKSNP